VQARRIYTGLRSNLMENMHGSFKETKTIWEQYSDVDGHGMRSRPFTGWSALLVLIATEQY
jgi:mannosyl-oligosaccharide glucosidase